MFVKSTGLHWLRCNTFRGVTALVSARRTALNQTVLHYINVTEPRPSLGPRGTAKSLLAGNAEAQEAPKRNVGAEETEKMSGLTVLALAPRCCLDSLTNWWCLY